MKQIIKGIGVLLMFGALTLSPVVSHASVSEGKSGGSITFNGWGDAPAPNPGTEGPQGSGTVAQPETVKPVGKLPSTGEVMKQSLSIIGLISVVLISIILFLLHKRKDDDETTQYSGYGGDDE